METKSNPTVNTCQNSLESFTQNLLKELERFSVSIEQKTSSFDAKYEKEKLTHLISVGGLDIQDIPMSGNLKLTTHLESCPHLQTFLSCFTASIARVCFVKDTSFKPESVLFKNEAYPLFYQAISVTLQDIKQQLINNFTTSSLKLYPINKYLNTGYLLIEFARSAENNFLHTSYFSPVQLKDSCLYDIQKLSQKIIHLNVKKKTKIKLKNPGLDVISAKQMEIYLSSFVTVFLLKKESEGAKKLYEACQHFLTLWEMLYKKFKNKYAGEWSYQSAINTFQGTVSPILVKLKPNERKPIEQAINIIGSQFQMFPAAPQRINRTLLLKALKLKKMANRPCDSTPYFDRPIFIVSAPRAGSTLLFETLSKFKELWSTGEENHALIEDIEGLHPQAHNFNSNRLNASDATEAIRDQLLESFTKKLVNRDQQHYLDLPLSHREINIRFLEKTPKNALRIPFIKALFPNALFIYLNREEKSNVSSLIDGWRSQRFISYKNIPGFEYRNWNFLLIPEWNRLSECSIGDIAQAQWHTSNQIIRNDLGKIPKEDWIPVYYKELIEHPEKVIQAVAEFAELKKDEVINIHTRNGLPISRLTLSAPKKDKWLKHNDFFKKKGYSFLYNEH